MARDLYSLNTNTYNFETKARTDFKYVPNESSMIAPFTQSGFIVIWIVSRL